MKKLLFAVIKLLTFNYYLKSKQKNTLLILMFHQVNDKNTIFYPAMSVSAFKDLCRFIKTNYTVINLSEIKNHFAKTDKPAAVITFDDGHYDILQHAFPILSEFDLPFTVNIDTEILETHKPQDFVRVYDILNHTQIKTYLNPKFMSKPIVINRSAPNITENEFTELLSKLSTEEKRELIEDLAEKAGMRDNAYSKMLAQQDIQYLSQQNIEFGSHSHTHSILTNLDTKQIHYELSHSKQTLENITQKNIAVLAYPNGIYNETVEKIAEKIGYTIMLQTNDQINHIKPGDNQINSYKRINQYHQTVEEALAHTYGFINTIKKLIGGRWKNIHSDY